MMLLRTIDNCEIDSPYIRCFISERVGSSVVAAVECGVAYGYIVYDADRIYYVYTAMEARRVGTASFLIQAVLNTTGPMKVMLHHSDKDAVKLFVNNGFTPIGRNGNYTVFSTVVNKNTSTTPFDAFKNNSEELLASLNLE